MRARLTIALATVLLGACSIIPRDGGPPRAAYYPGSELIGNEVRLETAQGQVSTLHFAENGEVHTSFGGRNYTGSWVATSGQLCFAWAGASRECWPYTGPLRRGQTLTLVSDRGNQVRVTLL